MQQNLLIHVIRECFKKQKIEENKTNKKITSIYAKTLAKHFQNTNTLEETYEKYRRYQWNSDKTQ